VIIGSQSILAQFPDAPEELVVSLEADVYPRNHPERAELIEGSIGELSMFHQTFGYYADGIDVHTATLPAGWEDRLVPIRGPGTAGNTGWALEIHDLLISKYVANREKDRHYTRAALRPCASILNEWLLYTTGRLRACSPHADTKGSRKGSF